MATLRLAMGLDEWKAIQIYDRKRHADVSGFNVFPNEAEGVIDAP
jgi:hypothetical protein